MSCTNCGCAASFVQFRAVQQLNNVKTCRKLSQKAVHAANLCCSSSPSSTTFHCPLSSIPDSAAAPHSLKLTFCINQPLTPLASLSLPTAPTRVQVIYKEPGHLQNTELEPHLRIQRGRDRQVDSNLDREEV